MAIASDTRTKHSFISAHFRDQVRNGHMAPGTQLPPERAIAEQFACSVGTVRRALSTLRQEGVIVCRPSSGVFIQEPPRRKMLGVIVPNVRNPDHAHLLDHLASAAAEGGYTTTVCVTNPSASTDGHNPRVEAEFIARMADLRATGIIRSPTGDGLQHERVTRARLRELRIPFVIVNDYWTDCAHEDHVCCNERQGVEMAVEYLMNHGHRRIAFLTEQHSQRPHAQSAFCNIIQERGLGGSQAFLCEADEFVRQACGGGPAERPTAVITMYRDTAERLIGAAAAAGLDVPSRLSLMTLTDMPSRSPMRTDVSAILTPVEEIARAALGTLLDERKAAFTHLYFNPILHEGETVHRLSQVSEAQITMR